MTHEPRGRADRLAGSGLFLAFLLLYAACGVAFHRTTPRAFAYLDQLFDADVPRRIIDLTRFSGPHDRTQLHPLLVLLLNPPGVAMRAILHAEGALNAGRLAAILMCAAAGAAGVGAFFALLRRSGLAAGTAFAWSLVFGLSSSQLFFAVFPESYVFSTLALLVLFALDRGPRTRVAAGVFAFGMNVVNIVAVALCRAQDLDWRHEPKAALRAAGLHLLLVLTATGALSALQATIYPGTAPLWSLDGLGRDDRLSFVWPRGPGDVAGRGRELLAYFFVWDLAAPATVVDRSEPFRTVVDFAPVSAAALRPAGMAHAMLWGALLTLAIVSAARTRAARHPVVTSLGLWVLSLVALHLVFGTSLFLYAGQWTFAVLALAAVLLGSEPVGPVMPRVLAGALFLLAALQAVTNAALLAEIARVFA